MKTYRVRFRWQGVRHTWEVTAPCVAAAKRYILNTFPRSRPYVLGA